MLKHLENKPAIGVITGIGTGLFAKLQYLLTDDHVIKIVSGLATWAGCLVAFLSLAVWSIKTINQVKSQLTKKP